MKTRHLPLVELLIGAYDLLAVDDAAREHSKHLQDLARQATAATTDEERKDIRAQASRLSPVVQDCGNAILAIRKAMRRMEIYHGLSCQAAYGQCAIEAAKKTPKYLQIVGRSKRKVPGEDVHE